MVRSSTRFHHHAAHLKTGYGGYILSTLNPSRVDHFTPLINSTQLKTSFAISTPSILISFMDLLFFLKIEILCWRIMTPSLRGGSISLGYLATGPARLTYTFNRTHLWVMIWALSLSKVRIVVRFIFTWNWEDY